MMKTLVQLCTVILLATGCQPPAEQSVTPPDTENTVAATALTDAELENLVRRSYQYVAMFNVNNKGAMDPRNPMGTGGWNRVKANPALQDHTMQAIARPNNDTLYIVAMLDLTEEPVILEWPAFDSKFVTLMVTGYDHYVNIPKSTRLGDFAQPERMLFYSSRTPGYAGEAVEGVDETFEATGDFLSAAFRVMPHANEPERLQRNLEAMARVEVHTLSEYRAGTDEPASFVPWSSSDDQRASLETREDALRFPPYGATDFDVFEDNFLEVMQFVFNHTSFDPGNELDQAVLAAFEPLGVAPGRVFDAEQVMAVDGARIRAVAERVAAEQLASARDPEFLAGNILQLFQPKAAMTLEPMVLQSVVGPVGQPASEAVYPTIATSDGTPMNAMHGYVIRMSADELPPATAFWSVTLYDTENGFFIPNDRKKYSVGENTGMQLNADGGIAIHIAAEPPTGVPPENWLPLNRGDYDVDIIMRVYAPDLGRFSTWAPPKAERVADVE